MILEIERKFLIINQSWRESVKTSRRIVQGYLADDGPASVRVRLDGDAANLNIKQSIVGAARAEYEYPISVDQAREMLDTLCVYPPIRKTRHLVDHAGHSWEIDVFDGANTGLIVAEIELASEDAAFARPSWLGREVTHRRSYYNHALAKHPYRQWQGDDG